MKRFYKDVSVERSAAGYHVALDGRPVKTQRGGSQIVGSKALAEELAAEWAGQGETIDPARFARRTLLRLR